MKDNQINANDIIKSAQKTGSLKDAVLEHAATYGIENIEELFPMPKNIDGAPVLINNPVEWVKVILDGVHKSPFARVKTMFADITAPTLKAKGYIKGDRKIEDVFSLLKRTTQPTTIYKKQKLDRDDVLDITDFNVIDLVKAEMRLKLDETIARSILIGDGRAIDDKYKINEECLRPIVNDDDLFAIKVSVAAGDRAANFIEAVVRNRKLYKGSGSPKLFTTEEIISDLLLMTDANGRRVYTSLEEIKAVLRISDIVPMNDIEGFVRYTNDGKNHEVLAIMVNLADYTIGTDKGGQVSLFDGFDIDYNQQKFLMEARCSGALTVPYSAMVFEDVTDKPTVLEADTLDLDEE